MAHWQPDAPRPLSERAAVSAAGSPGSPIDPCPHLKSCELACRDPSRACPRHDGAMVLMLGSNLNAARSSGLMPEPSEELVHSGPDEGGRTAQEEPKGGREDREDRADCEPEVVRQDRQ